MKNNIKRIVVFLLVLLSVMSVFAYAHPGRTDSAGGHTNHSTGEYHYHHGYDDHQHYDMNDDGIVDCPYKFKDNTIHKGSSNSNHTKSITEEFYEAMRQETEGSEAKAKIAPTKVNTPEEKQEKSSSHSVKTIIGRILAVIFCGPLMIYVPILIIAFICGEVRDLIQKKKK